MNWIESTLSKHGKKITQPRSQVISWILDYGKLFSVATILQQNPTLDKVSVYRTIELLTELDIIHSVGSKQNQERYELHEPSAHHHHIECTDCAKTACVPCTIVDPEITNFGQIHHSTFFEGVCNSCLKK